jgi:Subtilase family/Peptidase inhibitor I9
MIARRLFAPLLFFCLATAAHAGNGEIRKHEDPIRDRYIVVLEDSVARHEVRAAAAALAHAHGAAIHQVWSSALKGFAVEMTEGRARAMSHDPRVRFVEEDARIEISTVVPTNFDPSQPCDPAVSTCASTAENRMWALDRLEQNSAALNQRFGYCSTGAGVYIYVVDTGVMAQHSEFWVSETDTSHPRVLSGYNSSGDGLPADNPCNGWPTTLNAIYGGGHGTSVASVAAGRKVGFAKEATIVPVKVIACDPFAGTIAMLIDGVDWIVRVPGEEPNPNPEAYRDSATGKVRMLHPSVATFSTFARIASHTQANLLALDLALDALYDANVTVTASANNQNDDACTTTPARRSRGNPDPALRGKVITAGGSQIVNSPLGLPVSSGTYNPASPVSDARWVCDSAVDDTPCGGFTHGSNYGPCVTLFAPARNIISASLAGERSYRTGMGGGLTDDQKTYASGTSFSAPLVAGAAARMLQQFLPANRTPDAVYTQLTDPGRNNLQNMMDWATLGAGSPNIMMRFGDVAVTSPVSIGVDTNGSATLSVSATTGIPPLHYQWYRVTNPSYVPNTAPTLGWPLVTPIGTDSPSVTVSPTTRSSYWVSVRNDCCETDSNVATVFPRPGVPQNVTATLVPSATSGTVSWTPADNEAEMFEVFANSAGSGFAHVGGSSGNSFPFNIPLDTARVYSVRAVAGVGTPRVAASNFSNPDLAVGVPFTDVPIDTETFVKATHVTEVRRAMNALSDILGTARFYSASDTLYTSLVDDIIEAEHFSSPQSQFNQLRPALGLTTCNFTETPVVGMAIRKLHIDELRNCTK